MPAPHYRLPKDWSPQRQWDSHHTDLVVSYQSRDWYAVSRAAFELEYLEMLHPELQPKKEVKNEVKNEEKPRKKRIKKGAEAPVDAKSSNESVLLDGNQTADIVTHGDVHVS